MPKRRNYSAAFKREAVALANQPGVARAQIGRELDNNPNMIARWQRGLAANGSKAFFGQGVARDEEMAKLKREVNRLKKERDFYAKRQRSSRATGSEIPCHRSLPRSLSNTHDVSMPESVKEWLLRLA